MKKAIPYYPMCGCGPALGWTNVAHLDMSDSSQQCPDNLTLVTTPIRGLGVVCAIKNFEVYIAGREYELVTDHQALTYLSKSKNHNRCLMR